MIVHRCVFVILQSKQSKKQTSMSESRLPPSACRSCKKPLPRCAICLRSIGSESGKKAILFSNEIVQSND